MVQQLQAFGKVIELDLGLRGKNPRNLDTHASLCMLYANMKCSPRKIPDGHSNFGIEEARWRSWLSVWLESLRSESHQVDNIRKSKQDVRGPKPGTIVA